MTVTTISSTTSDSLTFALTAAEMQVLFGALTEGASIRITNGTDTEDIALSNVSASIMLVNDDDASTVQYFDGGKAGRYVMTGDADKTVSIDLLAASLLSSPISSDDFALYTLTVLAQPDEADVTPAASTLGNVDQLVFASATSLAVGMEVQDSVTGATGIVIGKSLVDGKTTVLVQRIGSTAFGATTNLTVVADEIGYDANMSASIGIFLPMIASLGGDSAVGILSGRAGLDGATFSTPELTVPSTLVNFLQAKYDAIVSSALNSVANLSALSYGDIVGGIVTAIDVLFGTDGNAGLIDQEIPFIRKSLNELIGLNGVRQLIVDLKSSDAQSLDAVKAALTKALAPFNATVTVDFTPITEAGQSGPTKMKAAISITGMQLDESVRVDVTGDDLEAALGVDLGPLSFEVGAEARVQANANFAFDLAFGIDPDTPVGEVPNFELYVGDGSGFALNVTDFSLTPSGSTTIDLGFAEGTVSLGAAAKIGVDAGTMTIENIDETAITPAALANLVGKTLVQGTSVFRVLAYREDTVGNNGALLIKRISGLPEGGNPAPLVEYNVTGESFGNRVVLDSGLVYFDSWYEDLPSYTGSAGSYFDGFGTLNSNAALDGEGMVRLSDGTSVAVIGTNALADGLTVTEFGFDAQSGLAAVKMSGAIPASIAVGTGVYIAGLEAIVTSVDGSDVLTVAFIGEVRPVAQGSGIRVALPVGGLTDGTNTFSIVSAELVDDSNAIRLGLTVGSDPTSAAEISTRNAAFNALLVGQIMSGSNDAKFRIVNVDVASGLVDLLWLQSEASDHDVVYSSGVVSLNVNGTQTAVSQMNLTTDGVVYLLKSSVTEDALDDIKSSISAGVLELNDVDVAAIDLVFEIETHVNG